MALRIKISGIHGYLGKLISSALITKGHQVSGIPRSCLVIDNPQLIKELKECDVVINLAGAPLLRRWTAKNRALIYNSRVYTTLALTTAIKKIKPNDRPQHLINASAVGIYKTSQTHDESSTNFNTGFLGKIVLNWEKSLKNLPKGVKYTVFRMGLVLGKGAQTMKYTIPLFKLGLGAKIGDGKQPFPFIHEADVVRAYIAAVEAELTPKTYNLVAPQQITNNDFIRTLADKVEKKAPWTVPLSLIKLTHGIASNILKESPEVIPQNLIDANFEYKYPNIKRALNEIVD